MKLVAFQRCSQIGLLLAIIAGSSCRTVYNPGVVEDVDEAGDIPSTYRMIDLGTLDDGGTEAVTINGTGQVVGSRVIVEPRRRTRGFFGTGPCGIWGPWVVPYGLGL